MLIETKPVLQDHVEVRLVDLDPDHPGFRDPEYRARRNAIAQIAMGYRAGEPIPAAPYTDLEHDVWQRSGKHWDQRTANMPAPSTSTCLDRLDFGTNRIPQLSEVSEKVEAISGFRLEPVAGLVEPRVFLESLANGVFLCTQYIRHHSTPLYTPEPDVAHEIIGHAVTLASTRLAEINRLFGEAVKHTKEARELDRLARVYWFTIEFGVLREDGRVKAYGTGLLSSAGELAEMHKAELRPLDLEAAANHVYDPTHYQSILFCADSFDQMDQMLRDFCLARW